MTNKSEDTSRFTFRGEEEAPESIFMADAENLRIEKLSTRVTLVAVLIPCLLVIILTVAYLDIKNRVINSQTTGSMGVQNLSKDLESRFSSLSLKQAKLETRQAKIESRVKEQKKALDTAAAGVQVNLKKSSAAQQASLDTAIGDLKRIIEKKPDKAALKAISKETKATEASVAELKKVIGELKGAFKKFDEELAGQILLMAKGLKKDQGRLAEIEKQTHQLDTEKLSKEAMDLALGLERLGIKEIVNDKIRELDGRLSTLNKQVDTLSKRLDVQARRASSPPKTAKKKAAPPKTTTPKGVPAPPKIVEQTIN